LEENNVEVYEQNAGCQTGFVVATEELPLENAFEEEAERKGWEANDWKREARQNWSWKKSKHGYLRNMVLRPTLSTVKMAIITQIVPIVL
jgi:hypothetical protein